MSVINTPQFENFIVAVMLSGAAYSGLQRKPELLMEVWLEEHN
jgi:hypothetical protein